jgi:hypothetical protein
MVPAFWMLVGRTVIVRRPIDVARAVALSAVVAVACSDGGRPPPPGGTTRSGPVLQTDAIVVRDRASARAAVGRRVRVTGTAQSGKLAAVVVDGGLLVYCLDLDRGRWPRDLEGQAVEAEGILQLTDQFASTTGPGGEITQGTEGSDFVIRESTVRPAGR